jgi:hypothetical protein
MQIAIGKVVVKVTVMASYRALSAEHSLYSLIVLYNDERREQYYWVVFHNIAKKGNNN